MVDDGLGETEGLERARRYAQHVAPTLVNVARRALDLAGVEPGDSVLDVGSATGLAAFLAAERAGREGSVIGLDPAPAMLAVARERSAAVGYDYIRWMQGPAAPLTFADESFDAVLCLQALHFLPSPHLVLEEMRRVLVEGGRLVVTLWGSKSANEWMGLLEQAVRHVAPGATGTSSTSGIAVPATLPLSQPGNLEALLQAAGFEDVEVARAPDRMRFQGTRAFWEWSRAVSPWAETLDALPEPLRLRVRASLDTRLRPRTRDGEVTIGREIVYARATAPEST